MLIFNMKLLLVFVGLVSVIFADRVPAQEKLDPDYSKWDNDDLKSIEYIKEELRNLVAAENLKHPVDLTSISIRFNRITDLLLLGVREIIKASGLDPIELPDQEINGAIPGINGGSLRLTNGKLSELSSLSRSGDVALSYTSNDRVSLSVPLAFQTLLATFDYNMRIILSNINGETEALVNKLHLQVEIGWDLNTNNATLYDASSDIENISVVFYGNDATDWLTNALTELLTPVLRTLLTTTLETVVRIPAQLFVDALNNFFQR